MLATSLLLYSHASSLGTLVLVSVIAASWTSARLVAHRRNAGSLAVAVALTLAPLLLLKYLPWTMELVHGAPWWRSAALYERGVPPGVSFMTLQAIGYVVDVYRRRVEPSRDILDHALFLAFLPQLVAGPIERAAILRPQLETPTRVGGIELYAAAKLALWGYALKLLFANPIGIASDELVARSVLDDPGAILSALALFSFRIYFDFYGYSCIAAAFGQMHGVKLTMNFLQPYGARSLVAFWRRWHVSLSTWLRDYVFVPLGGSKSGVPRYTLAVLAAFLVSGVWHGAGAGFMLWGAAHGLLLVLSRTVMRMRMYQILANATPERLWTSLGVGATWTIVTILWLPFLASPSADVPELLSAFGQVIRSPLLTGETLLAFALTYWWGIALAAMGLGVDRVVNSWYLGPPPRGRLHSLAEISVSNALVLALMLFGGYGSTQFIYFAF